MSVIGIDLGTTNSCVGVWRNGRVEIIANTLGARTTPSYVAFTDLQHLVGKPAVIKMSKNIDNTVYDIKRIIGRSYKDVQKYKLGLLFKVIEVEDRPNIEVVFKKERKNFTPEEISARILSEMKDIAEKFTGGPVEGAVITVPAYFNNAQRQATINAGKIAGLKVCRIINEPTAAALAYGDSMRSKGKKNVLIYDFGGGTFDVAIVEIEDSEKYTVKASTGDTHLGGRDIDQLLADHFADVCKSKLNKNVLDDIKAMCKLKATAETVKTFLSVNTLEYVCIDALKDGMDFEYKLSRIEFEDLCRGLITSTLDLVGKALQEGGMQKEDVHEVVLVGGCSRIPLVRELLLNFFPGKSLKESINPDEAVAHGAALLGAMINKETDIQFMNLVQDITSLSLGVEIEEGRMEVIIPRNSTMPCKVQKTFKTIKDVHVKANKSKITINIFEGESKFVKENHRLGSFLLSEIPMIKDKDRLVELVFGLDADGLLKVNAQDKVSGKKNELVIEMKTSGLSDEELKRMIREAESEREKLKLDKSGPDK